jgi:hypothetical protein
MSDELNETKIAAKVCIKCNVEKPLTEFWRHPDYLDGHQSTCKICASAHRRQKYRDEMSFRESAKEDARKYYHENRERCLLRNKEWVKRNREKALQYWKNVYMNNKPKRRNRVLQELYGITLVDYNELFILQNGRCAICGIHQVELTRALHVDHNHDTGEIRGLLCSNCNTGMGMFSDDVNMLQRVIAYLEKEL